VTDRASPDIEHLIAAAIESYVDNVHVSLPGIVVSYDSAKQTATVQPAIKRPIMNEDDQLVYEAYAPITNVPVEFPGAASLSFHWALAKGDSVVLLWQDFSFATWRKTGTVSEAGDTRKHGPSYPIARPWMRPSGGPGPDTDNSIGFVDGVRIRFAAGVVTVKATPGGADDFVALKSAVDAIQQNLDTLASFGTPFGPTVPGNLALCGPQDSSTVLKAGK
jgi:hypothetical protein